MTTDRGTLKASLSGVDFPISKERLVEFAENNGVDEETLRALRSLPTADYTNLTEVERSIPFNRETEEGQSPSDRARQAKGKGKHGVAEHQRETATNPIAEELGENRGS